MHHHPQAVPSRAARSHHGQDETRVGHGSNIANILVVVGVENRALAAAAAGLHQYEEGARRAGGHRYTPSQSRFLLILTPMAAHAERQADINRRYISSFRVLSPTITPPFSFIAQTFQVVRGRRDQGYISLT